MGHKGRLNLARALLLPAAALLGVGLVGPTLTITPGFGKWAGWVHLLDPSQTRKTTYSVLTGILALFHNGAAGIGTLLFGFSVIFPVIKLALLAAATATVGRGGWLLRLTHHAGKFSMLDVFVVALLVLAIKGLPGESTATLGWGIYAFAASVVMSIAAGWLIEGATPDASDG